jgi:hypothetical protein
MSAAPWPEHYGLEAARNHGRLDAHEHAHEHAYGAMCDRAFDLAVDTVFDRVHGDAFERIARRFKPRSWAFERAMTSAIRRGMDRAFDHGDVSRCADRMLDSEEVANAYRDAYLDGLQFALSERVGGVQ